MTTATVKMPPMYPEQRAAFFGHDRYVVTEATTKGGKTVGAIVWQAHQVLNDTLQLNHWWLAPTYSQAKIAYRRAKRMFGPMCSHNDSDLPLSFRNGSVWWFKTAEKPDNLYGEDVGSAVFDEFTRAREDAWFALRSTITATQGPVRFIGNVKGRGWGYQLARRAEAGEPNWAYHKITADHAIAAGVLTQSEVDDAERSLPDYVFRELYHCEPSDDGGNPFGLQHIAACVGDMGDPESCVGLGVDLARKVDWTVCIGLDDTGCVCVFDRWQRVPWADTRSRLGRLLGHTSALVDATGVGDPVVEEMVRDGMNVEPFVFTPKSKQQLMEGLAVAIQSREVTFPDGPIRVELEQFEYQQRGAHWYYSAPDGMHDDCVMALALAVQHKKDIGAGVPLIGVVAAGEHLADLDDDRGWTQWG
jgi:hypothetical protein